MKKIIILILGFAFHTCAYGQYMNKVRIEHIGEIDKPFTVIELYEIADSNKLKPLARTETIIDKKVYAKVLNYFNKKYIGQTDSINTTYGTFCITFFKDNKQSSQLFLNKEGAIFFFVHLHTLLVDSETKRQIIYSAIRRLI